MRHSLLLAIASASLVSASVYAQVADTDFHAFKPPAPSSAARPGTGSEATSGMTVYRPSGAKGGPATVVSGGSGDTVDAQAPGRTAPAPAPSSGDDPYTQSLREPMRMPASGEPLLPPPMTAKGLPLPPIPTIPGLSVPSPRTKQTVAQPEQINAYAPPAPKTLAPADTAPEKPSKSIGGGGIPEKAQELIDEKYSKSPTLREAALAFVKTNLDEWYQVQRSHKFSRVATRLSVEAQICLLAKIDHYSPDLADGFTKEFKHALTSTAELRQLYYDALQAAEYQEIVVDKDTDEACRDVGVTPEDVEAR